MRYQGYTQIEYPHYYTDDNKLSYYVSTSATSGNISTQYFGEKFDIGKVDCKIVIRISFFIPPSVRGDENVTLMFHVNKQTMKEVSDNDKMMYEYTDIDADLTHWSKNITAPGSYLSIYLDRKVSPDDITNLKLEMMPGFRLTWNYNTELKPEAEYSNAGTTKEFIR